MAYKKKSDILNNLHEDAECYGGGEYYVYFWEDERGMVFYVGCGKGTRFMVANESSRTYEFMRWYNYHDCRPRIVAYGMKREDALAFEKRLIRAFWDLDFPLTNKQNVPCLIVDP